MNQGLVQIAEPLERPNRKGRVDLQQPPGCVSCSFEMAKSDVTGGQERV